MLRVFVGYDPRQAVSYTALASSIVNRTSVPVAITPLVIGQLPIARTGLTPFTYSRFLVPWLCGYVGWALFLDVDMLALGDIADLFRMADDRFTVMVAKNEMKFEWASAMLFNNARCRVLTPRYVETAERLHAIAWAKDGEIGALRRMERSARFRRSGITSSDMTRRAATRSLCTLPRACRRIPKPRTANTATNGAAPCANRSAPCHGRS